MTKIAIILASVVSSYAFAVVTAFNGNADREYVCSQSLAAMVQPSTDPVAVQQMQQLHATRSRSETPIPEMQPMTPLVEGQYARQPEYATPPPQPQRENPFPGQSYGYEADPQPEESPYLHHQF